METIKRLKHNLEDVKDSYFESDMDHAFEEIEEDIERIQDPEFIIEWFENPFISDYDKNKVRQYLNKKP
jgi:hypothetical protein